MKVWVVNPFDNLPLEGYRPQRYWLMAKAFAAAGHEVTLVTSWWSHANKAPRRFVHGSEPAVGDTAPGDGFTVRFLQTPAYTKNISIRRFFSHIILARNFARELNLAKSTGTVPDLLVVSSPTLGLARAARKSGVPYIVDIMDDWPGTFERILPRWMLSPLAAIARRNCLGARKVSVVARKYADLVVNLGYRGPVKRFYHGIEMGTDPDKVQSAECGVPGAKGTVPREFRLVYIGNIGRSYDLETVVRGVMRLADEGVTLDIAGDGPDLARIREIAGDCPREIAGDCPHEITGVCPRAIRFHGYLGEAALVKLLADCDAGTVPMFADSEVGVPYKLADYVKAGLPVVNSLPGETEELLARYGAGVKYEAGNVDDLVGAVRKMRASLQNRRGLSQQECGVRSAECGVRRGLSPAFKSLFDAGRIYREYVEWALNEK